MTSRYRSTLKIRVTFTLIPAAIVAAMAGRPGSVAGILISTLSRSTCRRSSAACAMVASVSIASPGSTSMDTRPSTPSVSSYSGRKRSQASRTSVVVSVRTAVATSAPS